MKAGFLNRERSRRDSSSSGKLSTRNSSVCSTQHNLHNGGVSNSSSSIAQSPPSIVKEPPHLAPGLDDMTRGYAGDICCQKCQASVKEKYLLQCDSEGASCLAFMCLICILKKELCPACEKRPSRALCKAAKKGSEEFLFDIEKNGGALPGSPPLFHASANVAVLEPPPLDDYDDMPDLIEGTDEESEESDVDDSGGRSMSALKGKPAVATSFQPSLASAPLSNETSTSEYDSESDDGDEAPEFLSADEESEGEGDLDIESPPVSVSKSSSTTTSYSFIPTQHQREKLYPDARPFTSSPTSPTTTSESAGEREGREEMEISEQEKKNRAKKAAAKKLKKKKKQERNTEEAAQMLQEDRVAAAAQPTPLTSPSPVSTDSAYQSPSGPVMLKHDPNKKQPDYCLDIDCRIVEHFKGDSGCSVKELVKSTKSHRRKKGMQQKSVQQLVLVMDNFDGYGITLSNEAPRRLCVYGRKQEVAYVVNSVKSIFRNPPMWFPNDLAPLRPRSGEQDFKEARDAAARLLSAGSGFSFPLSRVDSAPGGVQGTEGHAEFFANANVANMTSAHASAIGRMSDSSTMPPLRGVSLASVSMDFDADTKDISTFMENLGLTRYRDAVLKEGVSLDGLKDMEESDLNELFEGKIPRGSFIKIRKALQGVMKEAQKLAAEKAAKAEETDSGGNCIICYVNLPDTACLPCGHAMFCHGCSWQGRLPFLPSSRGQVLQIFI